MSRTTSPDIDLWTAPPDDPTVSEAVKRVTATAFVINPETGQRVEGDTPNELPMVEALFARAAVDYLHVASHSGGIVGYVLYARGSVTNNPDVHLQGLTIMGVVPERQRQGIGTRLLEWSVQAMKGHCDALFVVGHPDFYARAGFVEAASVGLSVPFPAPSEACRVLLFGTCSLMPGVVFFHPIVHEFF